MSATTLECADPISVDEASAQQVRLSVCQLQRCSRRALCFLDAEPYWRTWAACAGAWESLSTCTSRRATCSSTSVAGRPQQLSRWCAQILKPCPPIVSHALPSACSGTPVPARRPPPTPPSVWQAVWWPRHQGQRPHLPRSRPPSPHRRGRRRLPRRRRPRCRKPSPLRRRRRHRRIHLRRRSRRDMAPPDACACARAQ